MTGTIERARGRWLEILPQLGIETRYLVNKHGPCPICRRGKDRFRFDDKDGTGSYYCNQCGPGVGIILICKLHGWDYATACREIDKIIGPDRPPAAPKRAGPDPAIEQARCKARIERILAEATERRVVEAFLRKRRLSVASRELFGHVACPYYDSDAHRLVGFFPAVVAPIRAADGTLESAAILYGAAAPEPRKKFLPKVHTITGAAVRLYDPEDGTLGIAEGIATALAAHQLFNVPVWSVLSEGNIGNFRLPPGVRRFLIFADTDLADPVGQDAAFALARRLKKADKGLRVEVYHPTALPEDYATRKKIDWADVVAEGRRL